MRRAAVAVALLVLALFGCRATVPRAQPGRILPFIVKLNKVEQPGLETLDQGKFATPAVFDSEKLKRELAASLNEAAVFTRVVTREEDGAGPLPDLELDITVTGHDFGPGELSFPGAIFSTLLWLFGGHLSWVIDDRQYPESEVTMVVSIRWSGQTSFSAQKPLRLDGLHLSFWERSDATNWFLNILTPPCLGDGDPASRGASLAERTPEFFAGRAGQVFLSFPGEYFNRVSSFLGYDPEKGEYVIVSRKALDFVFIRWEGGRTEELREKQLQLGVEDTTEKIRLWQQLAERLDGIETSDFYYPLSLKKGEPGLVRVEVLEGGEVDARWTVYLPPAGEVTGS